jgi:hypothetical protein
MHRDKIRAEMDRRLAMESEDRLDAREVALFELERELAELHRLAGYLEREGREDELDEVKDRVHEINETIEIEFQRLDY